MPGCPRCGIENPRGLCEFCEAAVASEATDDTPPARPVGRIRLGRTLEWLLYDSPGRSPFTEQTITRSMVVDALSRLAPAADVALRLSLDSDDDAIDVTFPSGTAIRVTVGVAPPTPDDADAVEVKPAP